MKAAQLIGLLLGFCSAFSAFAGGYDLDVEWEIASPPIKGSAAEKRDFAELRRWQSVRTDEECRTASKQNFMTAKSLFGPQTGLLSKADFEKVERLLDEIIETSERIAQPFKDEYMRPRPYDVGQGLQPCIRKPGGSKAYPSSHAIAGMASGLILAKLFPAHAAILKKAGVQIGTNRVLGGVHHPSDVSAGQNLAEQLVQALKFNPEFRSDFAEAKDSL